MGENDLLIGACAGQGITMDCVHEGGGGERRKNDNHKVVQITVLRWNPPSVRRASRRCLRAQTRTCRRTTIENCRLVSRLKANGRRCFRSPRTNDVDEMRIRAQRRRARSQSPASLFAFASIASRRTPPAEAPARAGQGRARGCLTASALRPANSKKSDRYERHVVVFRSQCRC